MAKSKIDIFFNDNALEFEKMPSENVWDNIETNLNKIDGIVVEKKPEKKSTININTAETTKTKEAKIVKFDAVKNENESKTKNENLNDKASLNFENIKWFVAAACFLLIFIPLMYVLNSGSKNNFVVAQKERPKFDIQQKVKSEKIINIENKRKEYIKDIKDSKKTFEVTKQKPVVKKPSIFSAKRDFGEAADIDKNFEEEQKIFEDVDEMPKFPGGEIEMLKFIYSNMNYPKAAKDKKIQGIVVLNFVVNNNGEINNIEVSRDIGYGCGQEAAEIIANMPNWIPAKNGNENVATKYQLPINFDLEQQEQIFALNKSLAKKKRTKQIVEKIEIIEEDEIVEEDENAEEKVLQKENSSKPEILAPNIITEKIVQIDHKGKIETVVSTKTKRENNRKNKVLNETKLQKSENANKTNSKNNDSFGVSYTNNAIEIINGNWNATLIGKGQFDNLKIEQNNDNTLLILYNKTGYELMKYELQNANEMGYIFSNNNQFNQSNIIVKVLNNNKIELTFNPPLPSEKNNSFKFKREF